MPFNSAGKNKDRPSLSNRNQYSYKSIFEMADVGIIISDLESGVIIAANPMACKMYGLQHEEMVGKLIIDLIEPVDHDLYNKFVAEIQVNSHSQALLRHCHKDRSISYVEVKGGKMDFGGQVCILNTLQDASHWVLAEKAFLEQAKIHDREQSTILDISQTLASSLELKPGIVLDELRIMIEYVHAVRFELEDTALVAVHARGSRSLEELLPFSLQLNDPRNDPQIMSGLFNERYPTLIEDVWSDEPEANALRAILDDKLVALLGDMHAWMWVPIKHKGRLLGGLGIAHPIKSFYNPHHADLALTVANQAAIAIANAELYVHARTLAALQERQKLARDIHDAVNQSLFSAGLIADVLPRLWEKDPLSARKELENLRRLILGAQADLRLLMTELRPNALIHTNLGDLIKQLGISLTARTNIPVKISIKEEMHPPGEVQLAFYRLCQEGFNNIAKHAEAKRVEVFYNSNKDGADLRIKDDGSGFDPNYHPAGHYGIVMMRERAKAVGASLNIISHLGKGTTILIHWPSKLEKEGLKA
jgi:PAS domain S-box-containing protein